MTTATLVRPLSLAGIPASAARPGLSAPLPQGSRELLRWER
jgi:hypothetical protein